MAKILIVDDQAPICELVERLVKRMKHEAFIAYDGASALVLLKKAVFDLLIADKNMPGMHGYELIEAARELQPKIRVVLMTAYPDGRPSPPLDGRLLKPFAISDLNRTVDQALAPRN